MKGATMTNPHESTARAVLAMHHAGELGYVRPSDEWTDATGHPLPEDWQQAAQHLVDNGQLPEFRRYQ
jgi:hypothetical protein